MVRTFGILKFPDIWLWQFPASGKKNQIRLNRITDIIMNFEGTKNWAGLAPKKENTSQIVG